MKYPLYSIITLIIAMIVLFLLFPAQLQEDESQLGVSIPMTIEKFSIKSSAFENNDLIPEKYTCDGVNANPPLEISGIPNRTESLVLIVDDPDSPSKIWSHWVLVDISPDIEKIDEDSVPVGAKQGVNDFGETKYGGPCPRSGEHHYFFKLFALDEKIDFAESVQKDDVEKRINGHVLSEAVLIGLYERR